VESILVWAKHCDAAVISVEYRHFPQLDAVEDCYAGLHWTFERSDELGIDPDRLIIAGGARGGGLAAGACLLARDRDGQTPSAQVLMCPMLDDRGATPSSVQMGGVGYYDSKANALAWRELLGEAAGGKEVSAYEAPARAADLGGLPPAYLDVGAVEPFRDEVISYANRIWCAGGDAELHVWGGAYHAYMGFGPSAVEQQTRAARLSWVRRHLIGEPAEPGSQVEPTI
jgi:acetyl esterase/lipase